MLSASPTSSEGHDVADFLERSRGRAPRMLAADAQLRSNAERCSRLPSRCFLLDATASRSPMSARQHDRSDAADSRGRGSPRDAVDGVRSCPYGAEGRFARPFITSREPRVERDESRGSQLRVGNTGASSTWGFSTRAADVLRVRGLRVGLAVDVWKQPDLLADRTSDAQHIGGGAVATVVVPIPRFLRSEWTEGIQISAGYKSQGFVPGEQLSGGGVVRAGIALGR